MLGTLFIISAPSGAGKTSLIKELLKTVNNVELSISHTTRAQREGEINGKDYHFVDNTVFQEMINNNQFIEHAHVFNNNYGTSSSHIQENLKTGKNILLEIDWQGAEQVIKTFPQAQTIFILPPSKQELRQRLNSRGQDSEDIIDARMEQAVNEMIHYKQYDFIVVNNDFDHALDELKAIFVADSLKKHHQLIKLEHLITDLLA